MHCKERIRRSSKSGDEKAGKGILSLAKLHFVTRMDGCLRMPWRAKEKKVRGSQNMERKLCSISSCGGGLRRCFLRRKLWSAGEGRA